MKILSFFLVLVYCGNIYSSNSVDEIYQRAYELLESNDSEQEDEEILFNFFSQEIANLDIEVLKQNPELVFRRAVAWADTLDPFKSFQNEMIQLPKIRDELQFVMDHAEEGSRLFRAAQLKWRLVDTVLQASPNNVDEILEAYLTFLEKSLQKWATNPLATGRELREQVFFNIQQDPSIAAAFYEYVLLSEDNPDIVLGYIEPEVWVTGVAFDEGGRSALLCKIECYVAGYTYTIEAQL